MRLTEITKKELFVNKLKDPVAADVIKYFELFKKSVRKMGWDADMADVEDGNWEITAYKTKDDISVHNNTHDGLEKARHIFLEVFVSSEIEDKHGVRIYRTDESTNYAEVTWAIDRN